MYPENIDHASFNMIMKLLISGMLNIESVLMFMDLALKHVKLKCHFLLVQLQMENVAASFQKYSYFRVTTTLIILYINV